MEGFILGWCCSLGWFTVIVPVFIVKKAFSVCID